MARRSGGVTAEERTEESDIVARTRSVPKSPAGCRRYMRGELTKQFPEIVDGFLKIAKEGSCPHVKLATELLQTEPTKKPRRSAAVNALLRKMAS